MLQSVSCILTEEEEDDDDDDDDEEENNNDDGDYETNFGRNVHCTASVLIKPIL